MVLTLVPRGIAVALVACAALFASTGPALASDPYDETTATAVTSPADPHFTYLDGTLDEDDDENANRLTIKGTADGDESLDIVCVYGGGDGGRRYVEVDWVDSEDLVKVGDDAYTWETNTHKSEFYDDRRRGLGPIDEAGRTCRLAAVPDDNIAEDGDLAAFTGPRVGVGLFLPDERSRSFGDGRAAKRGCCSGYEPANASYLATFPQLEGSMSHSAIGWGGLIDATPFNPSTLAPMENGSWDWGAGLFMTDLFGTGAQTLVDGVNAFNATTAPYDVDNVIENRGGGPDIPGQPELKVDLIAFDEATGAATIREVQDLVECNVPDGVDFDFFDIDDEMCPELVPTGVKHIRYVHQGEDGRVARIVDEYESTDGNAHNVDLQYDSGIEGGRPAWKVPGAADYGEFGDYDEVSLPAGEAGSFVTKDVGDGGGLDLEEILSECAMYEGFEWCVEEFFECVDEMGEAFCIAYFMDFGDNWRTNRHDFRADGSNDRATGSLTYAQKPDRAVFSGSDGFVLEYNRNVPAAGRSTLTHAFGAATTVAEAEGLAAAMERDFTPAAGAPAQAGAGSPPPANTPTPAPVVRRPAGMPIRLKSLSSRIRGRSFTLTVVCAPGQAQSGTLKVRTRQGKRWTLGTRAYQCPAGGQRTITFTLTRNQLRRLRQQGRRVRMSTYTVARDADGKLVSIGQVVSLTTK